MAAAVERSRRSMAGKRMGTLVGKAQEEDEAFWGHDTWADDPDDSGNDSFRESDEDSEAKKDHFDSDFDESETDEDENEEAAAGLDEDKRLAREEKTTGKKRTHVDISKAGRDLMHKKKVKGRNIAMGEGLNAGIVLNFPGFPGTGPAAVVPTPTKPPPPPVVEGGVATAAAAAVQQQVEVAPAPLPSAKPANSQTAAANRRATRSQDPRQRVLRQTTKQAGEVSKEAANVKTKEAAQVSQKVQTAKSKHKRMYTQAELLLEAVHVTEPENERWALERKRILHLEEQDHERAMLQQQAQGTIVIRRFHSKRGYLNTINFPSMDHVPEILTLKPPKPPPPPRECVITGQRARYRDPLTQMGYYDLAAFKELRRRHKAGEPLDQRPQKETETASNKATTRDKTKPTAVVSAETTKSSPVKSKRPNPRKRVMKPPKGTAPTSASSASILIESTQLVKAETEPSSNAKFPTGDVEKSVTTASGSKAPPCAPPSGSPASETVPSDAPIAAHAADVVSNKITKTTPPPKAPLPPKSATIPEPKSTTVPAAKPSVQPKRKPPSLAVHAADPAPTTGPSIPSAPAAPATAAQLHIPVHPHYAMYAYPFAHAGYQVHPYPPLPPSSVPPHPLAPVHQYPANPNHPMGYPYYLHPAQMHPAVAATYLPAAAASSATVSTRPPATTTNTAAAATTASVAPATTGTTTTGTALTAPPTDSASATRPLATTANVISPTAKQPAVASSPVSATPSRTATASASISAAAAASPAVSINPVTAAAQLPEATQTVTRTKPPSPMKAPLSPVAKTKESSSARTKPPSPMKSPSSPAAKTRESSSMKSPSSPAAKTRESSPRRAPAPAESPQRRSPRKRKPTEKAAAGAPEVPVLYGRRSKS